MEKIQTNLITKILLIPSIIGFVLVFLFSICLDIITCPFWIIGNLYSNFKKVENHNYIPIASITDSFMKNIWC